MSDLSVQPPPRSAARFWLGAAVIAAITAAAYLPAMQGDFLWDDDDYVTDNSALRTWQGLSDIWFEPAATPQYYPLVFTTFWVECRLWGLSPLAFHLGNVALHIIGAILVWRLLLRLSVPGAFLAAAIFAVHPVHLESVAWITERKNVLSAVFYLASMLTYFRFAGVEQARTDAGPGRWLAYALSILLFVAAMLSKTTACTLPAAITLLLWWKRPRLTMRDILPLLPMFFIGIGMGLNTARLERELVGALGADWDFSILDRVLIAGRAIWFYLATLLWPASLIFIYPRWTIDDSAWWQYLFPISAIVLGVTLFVVRNRIGKGPFVAAAFFAGTLFPALGFINVYPMLFSFVADHFQYLASLGPIALGAALLTMAGKKLGPLPSAACAFAIVAALGFLTWRQGRMYENRLTLWQTTVNRNPSAWIAQNNLSVELFEMGSYAATKGRYAEAKGRYAEALERARTTLILRPHYSKAYNNVGQALEGLGQIPEAIVNYNKAIELGPADPEPYLNLANALYAIGDLAGTERNIRAAIAAAPWYSAARHNLAVLQVMRGQTTEAIASCAEAIKLDPYGADSQMLMGVLLVQSGRRDEAVPYLRAALRLNPQLERARSELQRLGAKP